MISVTTKDKKVTGEHYKYVFAGMLVPGVIEGFPGWIGVKGEEPSGVAIVPGVGVLIVFSSSPRTTTIYPFDRIHEIETFREEPEDGEARGDSTNDTAGTS